jgi:hypothetical protein
MLNADDAQGVANAQHRIQVSSEFRQELSSVSLERAKLFTWEPCAEIVVDKLCEAHARHLERPSNPGRRILPPGTFTTRTMRTDGVIETNYSSTVIKNWVKDSAHRFVYKAAIRAYSLIRKRQ